VIAPRRGHPRAGPGFRSEGTRARPPFERRRQGRGPPAAAAAWTAGGAADGRGALPPLARRAQQGPSPGASPKKCCCAGQGCLRRQRGASPRRRPSGGAQGAESARRPGPPARARLACPRRRRPIAPVGLRRVCSCGRGAVERGLPDGLVPSRWKTRTLCAPRPQGAPIGRAASAQTPSSPPHPRGATQTRRERQKGAPPCSWRAAPPAQPSQACRRAC
jgi:hypothetical protein